MSRPDQLPTWATAGGADIDEPTDGQKETGWVNGQVPTAGWWNWWANLVYTWLVYIDPYIKPTGTVGFQYSDTSPPTLRRDISPPAGGWTPILLESGRIEPSYVTDGSVRCVQPAVGPTPLEEEDLECYLVFPFGQVGNTVGEYIKIKRLTMLYARADAGAVVVLRLVRALRDGTGSVDVVLSLTGTSTTGSFVTMTSASDADHDVDPDYAYWFEAVLTGVTATTEARISYASITYTKTRVE